MLIIFFAVACVVAWGFASLIAWYDYHLTYEDGVFNWRIFLGPVVYLNWVDKQRGDD